MRGAAIVLDPAARLIAESAITNHCQFRGWDAPAIAVRSNHVHVVIRFAGLRPEPMMSQLKSRATRLLREAGLFGREQPLWVDHGSTKWLWDEESVADACEYVIEGQDVERD